MIEYKEVPFNYRTRKGYEKVVLDNGDVWYTLDGNFHREDGPARIWTGVRKEYWLNGILVIPKTYHLFSPLELAKLGLI